MEKNLLICSGGTVISGKCFLHIAVMACLITYDKLVPEQLEVCDLDHEILKSDEV